MAKNREVGDKVLNSAKLTDSPVYPWGVELTKLRPRVVHTMGRDLRLEVLILHHCEHFWVEMRALSFLFDFRKWAYLNPRVHTGGSWGVTRRALLT